MSAEQQALAVARQLAAQGVPVFIAPPHRDRDRLGHKAGAKGYQLPADWQHTPADPRVLDAWRPGDALAMVCGHGVDVLDLDLYGGPEAGATIAELRQADALPGVIAEATTPSGGLHLLVRSLGVAKGRLPGIDVQAGTADGGCGFVFIAPTWAPSKLDGQPRPYVWQRAPQGPLGPDPHPEAAQRLRERLAAVRGPVGVELADTDRAGFDALPPAEQARVQTYLDGVVQGMAADLAAAQQWPDGRRDARGRGWEKLVADTAHRLACLAVSPWTPWTVEDARQRFDAVLPDPIAEAVPGKWAAQAGRAQPLPIPREHGLAAGDLTRLGIAPTVPATPDPDPFEAAVLAEQWTLRVREEARARHRAELDGDQPPVDLATVGEVLTREPEPPQRVQGLIPADASALIVGARKVGKTTLLLGLARHLLEGGRFLGRFDTPPCSGSVAILNYEVTGHMLARWAADARVPADRLILANLRGRRNPLAYDTDRAQLAAQLRAHNVEAVIVDPFTVAFQGFGDSENNAAEVRRFLATLDRFAREQVGASVLILSAHAGWEGERARGSSALEDWPDVTITVRRDAEEDNGPRYLSALGRDVDVPEDRLDYDPTGRELRLSGAGGRAEDKHARRVAAVLERVCTVLADSREPMSVAKIAEALRAQGQGAANAAIGEAVRLGVTSARLAATGGYNSHPAYRLAPISPISPASPGISPGTIPHPSPSPIGGGMIRAGDASTGISPQPLAAPIHPASPAAAGGAPFGVLPAPIPMRADGTPDTPTGRPATTGEESKP